MKLMIKTICIIFLFTLVGCNSRQSQSAHNNAVNSKDSIESVNTLSNKKFQTDRNNMISQNELYQRGETIRDLITKHFGDPSTMTKIYTDTLGNQKREIILWYRQNKIFAVVDRLTVKNEEVKSNESYFFDENNNCISHTVYDRNKEMDITDAMYAGTLIRYDVKYNQVELNDSQKQQIIQSSKASLDSIMQHFPEFKYFFNWK